MTSGMPSPLLMDTMGEVIADQPIQLADGDLSQRYIINDSSKEYFEDYESTPV